LDIEENSMNPFDAFHHHEEDLFSELRRVLQAAEGFVEATARDSGERLADARKQFAATLKDAHRYLGDAESLVKAKAKVAAASTDAYVRTNPWKSVGMAAGAGLILGLLISRR
jgi:ElaB/YqjD/DUF883 family membrane-anchored ribosome-binding protein